MSPHAGHVNARADAMMFDELFGDINDDSDDDAMVLGEMVGDTSDDSDVDMMLQSATEMLGELFGDSNGAEQLAGEAADVDGGRAASISDGAPHVDPDHAPVDAIAVEDLFGGFINEEQLAGTTSTANDSTATVAIDMTSAIAAATATAAVAVAAMRAKLVDEVAALAHHANQLRGIAELCAAGAIVHRDIAAEFAAIIASGYEVGNPSTAALVARHATVVAGVTNRWSDTAETAARHASTAAICASQLALDTGSNRAGGTAAIAGGDAAAAAAAAANTAAASQAAQTFANEALATTTHFMNHSRNTTTHRGDVTTHTGSWTYNTAPTNPNENDE